MNLSSPSSTKAVCKYGKLYLCICLDCTTLNHRGKFYASYDTAKLTGQCPTVHAFTRILFKCLLWYYYGQLFFFFMHKKYEQLLPGPYELCIIMTWCFWWSLPADLEWCHAVNIYPVQFLITLTQEHMGSNLIGGHWEKRRRTRPWRGILLGAIWRVKASRGLWKYSKVI